MKINKLLLASRHPAAVALPIEGELPSLGGATAWLNSPSLSAAGLRGKVVLVDFWTYTCVNWLRTLPYVRAWAEKYQEHSVVVIGVHTPEFPMEASGLRKPIPGTLAPSTLHLPVGPSWTGVASTLPPSGCGSIIGLWPVIGQWGGGLRC